MSNWTIRIVEVRKHEGIGSFFLFELFRRNTKGIEIPLTSTPEPLILSEEHFHELTIDLSADVWNDGLMIVKDGCAVGAEYPPEEIGTWVVGLYRDAPGDFLASIRQAVQHADSENMALMIPLLRKLIDKYPKYSVQ